MTKDDKGRQPQEQIACAKPQAVKALAFHLSKHVVNVLRSQAMRQNATLAAVVVMALVLPAVNAEVVSVRRHGSRQVLCMRSGLSSDLMECDAKPDWYTYVFVGQILSVRVSSNGEHAVRIVPEEVFLGHPGSLLHVMTSQGDCLPKLSTGARWLFYLRQPEKGPIVLDYYGNDSLPITAARDQIETLRRLKTMNASGLIKGRIDLRAGVQGLHVTATDNRNQARFQTTVHQDGGFEFPPLMPGQYTLSVTDPPADHIDNAEVDLKAGACLNQTLSRHPHGEIGGRISKADHSAARNVDVVLLNADATGYITTQTDENGRYHFDGLESGRFIVGVNSPSRKSWFNGSGGGKGIQLPPASLFYPEARDRSRAATINLHVDQRLDDLDIVLP